VAYAYEQDVPIDAALYARIIDNLGPEPMDGLLVHLCVTRPEGGLRYIDVWESEEKCAAAFEERIHPAVDAAFGAGRPAGEPEVRRLDLVHASGNVDVAVQLA
jgi:hypothetical protein